MPKPSRRVAPHGPGQRAISPPNARHRAKPAAPLLPGMTAGSAPYREALALYEQALAALQRHDYTGAHGMLRQLIACFPHERELIDRSRLYAALCERHLQPAADEPGNTQERLYAATLSLNAGLVDRAIAYLTRVVADEPANDRALYLLAVAYSERGEARLAIPYLEQAIAANPENRSLARTDPDLAALRRESAVSVLLGVPPRSRAGDGRYGRR